MSDRLPDGVTKEEWARTGARYRARFVHAHGEVEELGTFLDADEAGAAVEAAKQQAKARSEA